MMRPLKIPFFATLCLVTLAGCLGQPAAGPASDPSVQRVVERARADIGEEMFGAKVVAAYIDGQTLIFGFEIPDDVVSAGENAQTEFAKDVVREMASEFCGATTFRDYVSAGGIIRVDFASSKNLALLSVPFPITTEQQCA